MIFLCHLNRNPDLETVTIDINNKLIEKACRGDQKAMYRLYSMYLPAMYNTCIRMVVNKTPFLKVTRSVAAIAAITVLSVIAAYFIGRNRQHDLIFINIDPELAKKEVLFLNRIDNYSDLIKNTRVNIDQLVSGTKEIEYIDDLIHYYSKDLKNNGPNPKLINSLMDLYEKKILILNRMLNEIEKMKAMKNVKLICKLFLLLVLLSSSATYSYSQDDKEARFESSYKLNRDGKLTFRLYDSDLKVNVWKNNEVKLTGEIIITGGKTEDRDLLIAAFK